MNKDATLNQTTMFPWQCFLGTKQTKPWPRKIRSCFYSGNSNVDPANYVDLLILCILEFNPRDSIGNKCVCHNSSELNSTWEHSSCACKSTMSAIPTAMSWMLPWPSREPSNSPPNRRAGQSNTLTFTVVHRLCLSHIQNTLNMVHACSSSWCFTVS